MYSTLFQTIGNQFFSDMESTGIPADCIAGIADMSTTSNIIGMKNVQAIYFTGIRIGSNCCTGLFCEKCGTMIDPFYKRDGIVV